MADRAGARIAHVALAAIATVAAVAAVAGPARAAGRATYSVEIGAPDGPADGPAWRAEAIAAALRIDLADDQLRLAPPGAAAQLAVRGTIRGGELAYAIAREVGAPARGAVPLGGLDRRALAGALRDALHRLARPAEATPPAPPAELEAPGELGGALLALAAFAALLASPLAAGAIALRGRRRELLRSRALRRCAAAIAGVGAAAYALAAHGERLAEAAPAVLIAGGLAWGALAAWLAPIALPPLVGLHRVEPRELIPALGAWAALALVRLGALVGVLIAAVLGARALGDALGLPEAISIGVVAPASLLGLGLARRALVELLALRLDAELVDGDATSQQPWHPQIRAYLVGYLRRANLTVDEHLLERVRFLPGRRDGVAVYGGGLAPARIAIGRAMLEHALAPYGRPHDYLMPRVSTLHWTHWGLGLVVPTEPGTKLATRDDRQPHGVPDEGEPERIALGEPPTLSGIIEPIAFDPRTGYRPDEDPLWLDWDPGEEHDGTDAGDKDYLFGALVHALGVIARREDGGGALALAWRLWIAPRAIGRALGGLAWPLAPLRAFAARRAAALGDVHAALGGARHHLAQYLAWRLWRRDDLLTARAYVPELQQRSRAIAAALASDAPPADPADRAAGDLRRRLLGLGRYLAGVEHAPPRRRRLALALAALAGVAALAALAAQAVLYHPTWEQRTKPPPTARGEEKAPDGKGP
jgi:hypothetical protein